MDRCSVGAAKVRNAPGRSRMHLGETVSMDKLIAICAGAQPPFEQHAVAGVRFAAAQEAKKNGKKKGGEVGGFGGGGGKQKKGRESALSRSARLTRSPRRRAGRTERFAERAARGARAGARPDTAQPFLREALRFGGGRL